MIVVAEEDRRPTEIGAEEILDERVRTENLDPLVLHPQADFFGTVAGNFGVAVVLISGLEQPVNYLVLESEDGSELLGNVIRIEDTDPYNMAVTLEDVNRVARELLDPEAMMFVVVGKPEGV